MTREHTDRAYEAELRRLREQVLLMGAKVEEMLGNAIRALEQRDSDLARRSIDLDHEINRLEVETDGLCMRLLARRQPVASDLRLITIAMKLVTDLERIGDLGVNICERVIELMAEPPLGGLEIPRMAEAVRANLREALDAFVAGDAVRAQLVIERDRVVDAEYAEVFRQLLSAMTEDPRQITRATRLLAIAKYLERIGDHATNVAELTVFMVKGKDIRHVASALEQRERRHVPHGILFVCVRNAARSQMAEGWARKLLLPGVRIWSAGSEPAEELHPLAVEVMREVGIDLSLQWPKRVSEVPLGDIDTVVTLCSEEVCVLPGDLDQRTWVLPDPAAAVGTEDERKATFRRVRDELKRRIEELAG